MSYDDICYFSVMLGCFFIRCHWENRITLEENDYGSIACGGDGWFWILLEVASTARHVLHSTCVDASGLLDPK
jgi:hypothetical protein